MKNAVIRIVEDGTMFTGLADDDGAGGVVILKADWSGPGTPEVIAWLDELRRRPNVAYIEIHKADLLGVQLDGDSAAAVPTGYTRKDFAPPTARLAV
jgi:hypothetical protein